MLASPMLQAADAQTLTVQVVLAILGGIALLLALLGKIELKGQILVPEIPPLLRVLSFLVGAVVIGIAIWLIIPQPPPPPPTSTALAALSITATETQPTLTDTPLPPTATFTPTAPPTDTPTPSPTPCPVGLLCDVLQQVDGGALFVFVNLPGSLNYEFTSDCAQSGPYGLKLTYGFTGVGYGGWGVHWDNAPTKHFDASKFNNLAFWVKGIAGGETFQVGLKDTSVKEVNVQSKDWVGVGKEGTSVVIPLSQFKDKGVNITSLNNVNFGFNKSHGSGSICIDNIAFVP